jgi:hypothetical protein
MYIYFDPEFRVSVGRIIYFLHAECQNCGYLIYSNQKANANAYIRIFPCKYFTFNDSTQRSCIFFEFFWISYGRFGGAASDKIGRILRKIQKIHPKGCTIKWELICESQMVYYLYGALCPAVSVGASQKNPISVLQKWKTHFLWNETKSASLAFLAIPRATTSRKTLIGGMQFYGALVSSAPQKLFLWRTKSGAPQKYIISVAHQKTIRHRNRVGPTPYQPQSLVPLFLWRIRASAPQN